MSYSRWINSYWYTYPTHMNDNTVFAINCNWYYFPEQLDTENKRELAIIEIRERCKEEYHPDKQPTEAELEELKGYMKQFVGEINKGTYNGLD